MRPTCDIDALAAAAVGILGAPLRRLINKLGCWQDAGWSTLSRADPAFQIKTMTLAQMGKKAMKQEHIDADGKQCSTHKLF